MAYSKKERQEIKNLIMEGLKGKRQVPGITGIGNPELVPDKAVEGIAEFLLKWIEVE